MDYSIAPGWKWIANKEAVSLFKKLDIKPHHKMLLLSDGSLTRFLEALNQSTVYVEIKEHGVHKIKKQEAAYLEIAGGEEAIVRDVWLIQNKKKLVYAHSVFPLAGLDKHFLDNISTSIEPLGKNLTDRGLLTFKDKLEICAVCCSYVNKALNLEPETILWAKHYRLSAKAQDGFNQRLSLSGEKDITASIIEIFSSELAGRPPRI
ncbi:MAG: chorismate lyase [Deltaproteobacteria bacterium]|nr:chorismate lyase [Deltaproteobacteria bacterium]